MKTGARSRLLFVTLFIFSSIVALGLTPTAFVRAWGLRAHELVAERAMKLLPDEPFFDAFGDLIVEYSIYPDTKWRGEDPNEQYRHYYDVDLSPDGRDPKLGMLPWALSDNYRMFVEALKAEDWERAALLAGAIAHYATDVTMPLHTTSDYNPGSMHVVFEDRADAMLDEVTIYNYRPKLLENVFQAVVEVAHESFSFTGYENDKINYWLTQGVLWNDVLRTMAENRLNAAVQLTSDIWYTALVEAGLLKLGVPAEEGSRVAWTIPVAAAILVVALAATAYVLRRRAPVQPAQRFISCNADFGRARRAVEGGRLEG